MYEDCPKIVKEFLFYMETIKGRSKRTVDGYCFDLKTFFKFIKKHKKTVPEVTEFNDIIITDIDIDFLRTITLSDVYEFLHYVSNDRKNQAKTRARKVSCLKVFFRFVTVNLKLLEENPVENLEVPSTKKSLPKYLTLENCKSLLENIDGEYKKRDFCMIFLFLNCGMRLSELVGINISDIKENQLLLKGKGNKERIVYLNQPCINCIGDYMDFRFEKFLNIKNEHKNALFLSRNGNRISNRQVELIVQKYLEKAGLSGMGFSPHKLRHTAATMMYQHSNVDVRILQEILGHTNLGTTEIYTHVSNKQLEKAMKDTPLATLLDSTTNSPENADEDTDDMSENSEK